MHATIGEHGIDGDPTAAIDAVTICKSDESRHRFRPVAICPRCPAVKQEGPFVEVARLANAPCNSSGRRPIRGKELAQRPGASIDEFIEAEGGGFVRHALPANIAIQTAPDERCLKQMHVRIGAWREPRVFVFEISAARMRMGLLQCPAQGERALAPARSWAMQALAGRIGEKRKSLIVEIELWIMRASIDIDHRQYAAVRRHKMLEETERMFGCLAPRSWPAKLSRFEKGKCLTRYAARAVWLRDRIAGKVDCLVKAAANAIRADLPP